MFSFWPSLVLTLTLALRLRQGPHCALSLGSDPGSSRCCHSQEERGGPGTLASWDLAHSASQSSVQVTDSRDPCQTAPTHARWTGSSPGLEGLAADLSPLRGSPHPHLPSGSLLQQASVPLRDAECPRRSSFWGKCLRLSKHTPKHTLC